MARKFLSPLDKASRQLSAFQEAQTQELGVSSIEGHLLSYLRKYGPVPVWELVRAFGIKQSTLTSILDRLEKSGRIRREKGVDDRRSFQVHISDDGRKLAKRLNRLLETIEDDIRERVSSRDVAGFQAVLGAVDEIAQARLPSRNSSTKKPGLPAWSGV